MYKTCITVAQTVLHVDAAASVESLQVCKLVNFRIIEASLFNLCSARPCIATTGTRNLIATAVTVVRDFIAVVVQLAIPCLH